MKRLSLTGLLFAAACAPASASLPAERYGFIARLGTDTISLEGVVRTGNTLESNEVDRFPRVRIRHTQITLDTNGAIRRLVMDITTPSEPENERERHVVADVTSDSVHITKTDKAGTKQIAFATGGVLTMAHLPQMYSLYDLYFAAAFKHADATKLAAGDSVHLHQFYIDREFDRFPLHSGFVKPLPGNKAEIWHDWLAGIGEATFDSAHRMLTYSGDRSTYKIAVQRLNELPDTKTVGEQFAMRETATGMVQLSVRDTVRANIGNAAFTIDYSRPLARGRTLLGNIIPYNEVWRTGANAATQFSTSAPIVIGGVRLAAGKYTLWTVPREKGTDLVLNEQVGQWGTGYNSDYDLGQAKMATATTTAPVEKFTISIVPTDKTHGTMLMEWGTFRWTVGIVVP